MLREIIAYIKLSQTSESETNKSFKSFCVNVCANAFYESLTEDQKNILRKVMSNEKF